VRSEKADKTYMKNTPHVPLRQSTEEKKTREGAVGLFPAELKKAKAEGKKCHAKTV
jgi:hypothetical protein